MTTPQFDIPCVILCGGKSSRMGEDKALLPFSTYDTLTQYQYERLKPYFKEIYLSSKTNKFNFNANIIYDNTRDESSPLIALKSILETIESDRVFIITVDTPFVKTVTISKLIINSNISNITIAITSNEHYLCGVYNKSCLSLINRMILDNNHKVGDIMKNTTSKKIQFYDENEFLNLNKIEDYKKALSIIS